MRDGVMPADQATFESLLEEADRLVRLSQSLNALAEGDAGARMPTAQDLDLAAAIRSAVELARPALTRAQIEVMVEVPPELPARGNPDQIAQVLANLLQNAVRYTPSAAGSRFGRRRGPATCWSSWRTRARAFRRPTSIASSSASTGSTSRATGRWAGPVSGSR